MQILLCCLEYLSRPMTRGIPFTSPNYLQRFQTVEGESSSSHDAQCSEARDRSGVRANNDYPHIGGHQTTETD